MSEKVTVSLYLQKNIRRIASPLTQDHIVDSSNDRNIVLCRKIVVDGDSGDPFVVCAVCGGSMYRFVVLDFSELKIRVH